MGLSAPRKGTHYDLIVVVVLDENMLQWGHDLSVMETVFVSYFKGSVHLPFAAGRVQSRLTK